MSFQITLIELITLFGIVNGLTFSFLLLTKKENRKANRFLALLVISMCFTFTPYVLESSIWHKFRWLVWMPFSLSYWIGPSFYFYVKTLTVDYKFRKKDLWHFSPLGLNYIHSIYHASITYGNPYPVLHHISEFFESAAILSILIYVLLSYRLIVNYSKNLLNKVSNIEFINLKWIKKMILTIAISFILILIFLWVSSAISGKESLSQWTSLKSIVLLMYVAILYWLSISGYKQTQVINIAMKSTTSKEVEIITTTIRKLQEVMNKDLLFRNPELTLFDVSKSIGISERAISEAINKELNKNYYRFINEYRIEEVKKKLLDPNNNHLKIMSLALEAGFNSKASFNRVFKLYVGQTPKQFKLNNQ